MIESGHRLWLRRSPNQKIPTTMHEAKYIQAFVLLRVAFFGFQADVKSYERAASATQRHQLLAELLCSPVLLTVTQNLDVKVKLNLTLC